MILVVDDDAEQRALVCDALIRAGLKAVGAADGAEALRIVRRVGVPAVVLLDLLMPEKDGWQVLWDLRHGKETADVPVVVMSALPDAREALNGAEVQGYLAKPFEIDELLGALHDALAPPVVTKARARSR